MLPDRSVLIGQILVKNGKIQMRHFELFSNNVSKLVMALFSEKTKFYVTLFGSKCCGGSYISL